jgi:hypothetical protein
VSGSAACSSSTTAKPRNPSAVFSHTTPSETTPVVLTDAGVENVNAQVDDLITTGVLRRVVAFTELKFSNSMIEAWWRSLKHQWLFLHVTERREPGRPCRVWSRPVPRGKNAHDILVDGNVEGQHDLLGDSWTTPCRIAPFHIEDGGHHVVAGSARARFLPDRGREQQAIFASLQRSMKAEERCGLQDNPGTD